MDKLINDPASYVDEALDGLCAVWPDYRRTGRAGRVVTRAAAARPGTVGVVSGGGFGHLPLFAGYVGDGLLSACAVGNVFAGPSADMCLDAIRAADTGAGVVCLLGNYGGDRMSFAQACEDYESEDASHRTRTVVVADDVASASPADAARRRGVAGLVLAYKAAGAAAARGDTLDEVASVAGHAASRTRTIGVALSACTIPGASAPGFTVTPGHVEIGMGIHGEAGLESTPLPTSDTLSAGLIDRLLADQPLAPGARVAVLVNSLGATPLEELLIVYRYVAGRLATAGVEVKRRYVGHYVTSMEMAGFSISLMQLDDGLDALLGVPCGCPFWRQG